jgi:hypothetical protein
MHEQPGVPDRGSQGAVMDFIYVGTTLLFFGLAVLFVHACERL